MQRGEIAFHVLRTTQDFLASSMGSDHEKSKEGAPAKDRR